jgi:hypothetical protein
MSPHLSGCRSKIRRNPDHADTNDNWHTLRPLQRILLDSSVRVQPHASLKTYLVSALSEGKVEYYECQACGTKLLRQPQSDPSTRWQLVF